MSTRPHSPTASRARAARRRFVDRIAHVVLASASFAVLLCLPAILLVFFLEAVGLAKGTRVTPGKRLVVNQFGAPLHVQVDEYGQVAFVVTAQGGRFYSLKDGSPIADAPVLDPSPATVTAVQGPVRDSNYRFVRTVFALSDGRLVLADVSWHLASHNGERVVTPVLKLQTPIQADPDRRPLRLLAHGVSDLGPVSAVAVGPREVVLVTQRRKKSLMGSSEAKVKIGKLPVQLDDDITALAMDPRADDLFVGTASGGVVRVDLRDPDQPIAYPAMRFGGKAGTAVSALGFLTGGRTLLVGDAAGGVYGLHRLETSAIVPPYAFLCRFRDQMAPIRAFAACECDRTFLSLDARGGIFLRHATTGETLKELDVPEVGAAGFDPRGREIATLGEGGALRLWPLQRGHPEITARTLFQPVQYEGDAEPGFRWQPEGSADDFESKYSLTPLFFGTLKGTLAALIVAVPLGLLAAIYATQFMRPSLRTLVATGMQIMSAVPTVVLGFIAAFWLAPTLASGELGLEIMPTVLAAAVLFAAFAWQRVIRLQGREVLVLVPVVLVAMGLAWKLGGLLQESLPSASFPEWVQTSLGLKFDERNTVVIGVVLGFAIIPTIFTIAEEALSGVPRPLIAGSLALGASPWQTAMNIVLPSASPGLLSAVLLGAGRAAGETMIVLMVSGNRAIVDPSPYTGFRSATANMAIHFGGCGCIEDTTLWRVMFLSTVMLVIVMFVVNTLAEIIRIRLRMKHQET